MLIDRTLEITFAFTSVDVTGILLNQQIKIRFEHTLDLIAEDG